MDSRISARRLSSALGGWRTRQPAYESLADGIRLLGLDGRLAAHTALPAERELASALGVSRTTVAAAYASLRESGHIESLRGSGSVTVPARQRNVSRVVVGDAGIDLQQASPAAWPGLAGVFAETANEAASLLARPGYDVVGRAELRAAIADRYRERGLPTDPEQILVTNGGQAAIHLMSATLLRRGDRAIAETPTYPHALEAMRDAGARVSAIPVTPDDGWDLDRGSQVFARTAPTLAYLMPDFHNPTGREMTAAEQALITDAAARAGTTLVVDETVSELAIDPAAAARTVSLPTASIRIGSLGKTVWGGLRVGWIRADAEVIQRLQAARPHRDLGTPEFEQAVAARILARMPEILQQRGELLREGRDAVIRALGELLPEWRVPEVRGGVAVWVELDAPLSGGLVLAARAEGVYLSSGSRFGVDGGHERRLRVPFTAPVPQLEQAIAALARVWPRVRTDSLSGVDLMDAVV